MVGWAVPIDTKLPYVLRSKIIAVKWFSRGAATVNSQGDQFSSNRCPPLEFQEKCLGALEGRNKMVPPFQGLRFDDW